MNRDQRVLCAQQTLKAIEDGFYTIGEHRIELAASTQAAISGSVGIRPDELIPSTPTAWHETLFAVTAESTMAASYRLAAQGPVCALNFASAKNPGGGFMSGAQAQEEALTRSSALHPCLLTQPDYYRDNKYYKTLLYTDHMIYSPAVPFFRDDEGGWLAAPILISISPRSQCRRCRQSRAGIPAAPGRMLRPAHPPFARDCRCPRRRTPGARRLGMWRLRQRPLHGRQTLP